jgi:hypothetical protein
LHGEGRIVNHKKMRLMKENGLSVQAPAFYCND